MKQIEVGIMVRQSIRPVVDEEYPLSNTVYECSLLAIITSAGYGVMVTAPPFQPHARNGTRAMCPSTYLFIQHSATLAE